MNGKKYSSFELDKRTPKRDIGDIKPRYSWSLKVDGYSDREHPLIDGGYVNDWKTLKSAKINLMRHLGVGSIVYRLFNYSFGLSDSAIQQTQSELKDKYQKLLSEYNEFEKEEHDYNYHVKRLDYAENLLEYQSAIKELPRTKIEVVRFLTIVILIASIGPWVFLK